MNNNKVFKLFPLKGFIAVCILYVTFWLPNFITQPLGKCFGWLAFSLSKKMRNIILTNLSFAFSDMPENEKFQLAKKSAIQSGLFFSEFPDAWLGNRNQIENQIIEIKQQNLIDQINAEKMPLVIIAPHLGNWEFLVQWIQINYPLIGLYSPSKIPQIDQLIFNARKKFGCEPHATDNRGIMQLLKGLKQGGTMMMLPDQVPRKDAGIYTPFFGQSAYTMTLLHKLVKKSKAKVLFAACLRREDGKGFNIEIEQPNFDASESDVEVFNLGMNQQIETMIYRNPAQYVWDYKRYKRQPDDVSLY